MNSYTNELLDQFKKRKGIDSDYAAAKELGVRPNRLSNYRTGVSHADDRTAVMLADALGLDRLKTIARINMDRARDAGEKAFWRQIAAAAAIAIMTVGLALPVPARATSTGDANLNEHSQYALCEVLEGNYAGLVAGSALGLTRALARCPPCRPDGNTSPVISIGASWTTT